MSPPIFFEKGDFVIVVDLDLTLISSQIYRPELGTPQ
jgi:hypothetical protein